MVNRLLLTLALRFVIPSSFAVNELRVSSEAMLMLVFVISPVESFVMVTYRLPFVVLVDIDVASVYVPLIVN